MSKKQNYARTRAQYHTNPSSAVSVPPTVYAQIEAVRQSGVVNVHTHLVPALREFGFDEALSWLINNPSAGGLLLKHGMEPTSPRAVPDIDPDRLRAQVTDVEFTKREPATVEQANILSYVEELIGLCDYAHGYYTDGTWRTVAELTDDERKEAERLIKVLDCVPNSCYRNAQLVTAGKRGELAYVEGFVLPGDTRNPLEHAWVEMNGKVVELTLPSRPQPTPEATYFGKSFSYESVVDEVNSAREAHYLAGRQ